MNVTLTRFLSWTGIICLSFLIALFATSCHKRTIPYNQEPDTRGQEYDKTRDPNTMRIEGGRLWSYLLSQKSTMGVRKQFDKIRFYPNSWTPVDDFFANLAVQKIVYDPTDKDIYYFCTGEGWGNADAVRGAGVWKSDDAGERWYQLPLTMGPEFDYCMDMLVHPVTGYVYVATKSNGVMRSIDKGGTWEQVLGIGKGATFNTSSDLELTADNELFVSIGVFNTDGIYFSTSGNPGSWEKRTKGFPTNTFRIELATAPSNANVVYAIPISSTSSDDRRIIGVYRSDDKGLNWKKVASPAGDRSLAGNQGWYDLIIEVDPNNDQVVLAGGINMYRSINGGGSWQLMFDGYRKVKGVQYVHPDQHEIVFMNSDTIFIGNDGGIYRCDNMTADTPYFYSINDNYNVTQYYSCAQEGQALSHRVIGGTQDNGSNGSTGKGISGFEQLSWSDGGFSQINYNNPEVFYTTTQYATIYRSRNRVIDTISNPSNIGALFINPLELDPNDPEILYQSGTTGIWRLKNASMAAKQDWVRASSPFGYISAFGITKNPANVIFLGKGDGGIIWRLNNANTSDFQKVPVNCDPKGMLPNQSIYCSSVCVDPSDGNHVVITYSNYGVESVWESKNALSASPDWYSQEGDMPDLPIRWAVLNPKNPEVCYLATEAGVMMTKKLNGKNTQWVLINEGMANVRVDMLKVRENDMNIVAATHGRGIFTGTIKSDYSVVWEERGPMNIGGRTRTIMLDPNDPLKKKIWAGSVSGGLWVANDYDSVPVFTQIEYAPYEIKVGPNPVDNNKVGIFITTNVNRKIDIDIYNINGQLVEQQSRFLNEGEHRFEVNLASFRSAIYYMQVSNGEEKRVFKLLVQ